MSFTRSWARMPKKRARRGNQRRIRNIARVSVLVAVVGAYVIYWAVTPNAVEVPKLEPSPTEVNVLGVVLRNPSYKFVTGEIIRIETEVDVPSLGGGTTILQSIPAEYPFTLYPQGTVTVEVPMNFRVLPGVDYDIFLTFDGGGQQTVTIALPSSPG